MPKSTPRSRKARQQASPAKKTRTLSRQGELAAPDTVESSSNDLYPCPPLSLLRTHSNIIVNADASSFSNSHDFVVKNSTFYNVQADRDTVVLGMKELSKRIIDGAEFDSSLRDPPPQCHPGTRVRLHGKVYMWCRNAEREKALLWLYGPAGVGKSAVIQALAESLAESKCLGASLFFSRLNDRNDPQCVFFTVAFQLATRIPAYQTYITNQIALNPSLLSKGMKEQFRIFITEPFGNQGIGKEGGQLAILLDGLDECNGVDEQRRIIEFVSKFVLDFPGAPLVWSISSRPEPDIVAAFNAEAVVLSYWSEYVPIDSTESCQDVERYLNFSFVAMRKQYPYIPSSWPSEKEFLKLANGALGLFVFARTAVRFMEDPNHADPESRLTLILSVIDHLDVVVTDDHPFALLDALYFRILSSIPPTLRHTTKRILGFIICTRLKRFGTYDGLSHPLESRSLMGASIILGLKRSVVYSSLHKLHSVLQIPQWKDAHTSEMTFLHASFVDYLVDRTRSKEFWIDRGECVDEITQRLYQLYLAKPWDSNWALYTPQLSREMGSIFYKDLKSSLESGLRYAVFGNLRSLRGRGPFVSQQDRSECLDVLTEINVINELESLNPDRICPILFNLWDCFPDELTSRGLCKPLQMRDLNLDHLEYGRNKPYVSTIRQQNTSPDSPDALKDFVTTLRLSQERHPEQLVLLFGCTPEKRNAFVWFKQSDDASLLDSQYCIPYPY